jgi:hypothetical protein
MDTSQRDYGVLRREHVRALAALDQHIEQKTDPAIEAGQPQERAARAERAAEPQASRESEAPPQPHRNDYGILRKEHARALDALNEHADRAGAGADRGAEVEPTRPTEMPTRSFRWTGRGGMAPQEASAIAWNKVIHQRLARQALDRHIAESRSRSDDTPEVAPDQTRDRGDGGVER